MEPKQDRKDENRKHHGPVKKTTAIVLSLNVSVWTLRCSELGPRGDNSRLTLATASGTPQNSTNDIPTLEYSTEPAIQYGVLHGVPSNSLHDQF